MKASPDPRHTGPKRKKAGGWPELPPSKSFTLWVPNEHHEKLRKLAGEKKQRVGALVRQVISEILKDGHGKPRNGQGSEIPGATAAGPVRGMRKASAAPVPR